MGKTGVGFDVYVNADESVQNRQKKIDEVAGKLMVENLEALSELSTVKE